jgi:hypothetical protein
LPPPAIRFINARRPAREARADAAFQRGAPAQVFEVDVMRDAVEVEGRVADVGGRDGVNPAADARDGVVGEQFRLRAAAAGEDFDEGAANLFVAHPGALAVGVEPREQALEILALPIPLVFHRGSNGRGGN